MARRQPARGLIMDLNQDHGGHSEWFAASWATLAQPSMIMGRYSKEQPERFPAA
jgi:hypothetical protein